MCGARRNRNCGKCLHHPQGRVLEQPRSGPEHHKPGLRLVPNNRGHSIQSKAPKHRLANLMEKSPLGLHGHQHRPSLLLVPSKQVHSIQGKAQAQQRLQQRRVLEQCHSGLGPVLLGPHSRQHRPSLQLAPSNWVLSAQGKAPTQHLGSRRHPDLPGVLQHRV